MTNKLYIGRESHLYDNWALTMLRRWATTTSWPTTWARCTRSVPATSAASLAGPSTAALTRAGAHSASSWRSWPGPPCGIRASCGSTSGTISSWTSKAVPTRGAKKATSKLRLLRAAATRILSRLVTWRMMVQLNWVKAEWLASHSEGCQNAAQNVSFHLVNDSFSCTSS